MSFKPLIVDRRYYEAEARAIQDGKDVALTDYRDLLWAHATLVERLNCMQEILYRERQVAKPNVTGRGKR